MALVLVVLFSSVGFSLRRKLLRAADLQNKETRKRVLLSWLGWRRAHEKNDSARQPSIAICADGYLWRRRLFHGPLASGPTLLCAIALAIGVAAILEGCKSGSGSGGGATGTPAGSYKMTVQATAQAAPRGITVTLDVQ